MARLIAAPVRRAVALLGLVGLILSGLLQGAESPLSEPALLAPSPAAVAARQVALVTPPQLLEISADFPGPDTAYLTLGTLMSEGKEPLTAPLTAPAIPGAGLPSLGGGKPEDSWRHRLARRMQSMGQQLVSPRRVAGALRQLQTAPDAVPGTIGEQMQRQAVRAVLDTGIDELKRLEGTHLRNLKLRYRTPLGDQKALLEMETLISLLDTQEGLLFGQAGLLWQDGDEAVNVGGGYRHTAADGALLLGVNAFYDYLSDPGLQRYSLGLEAKGRIADLYANLYQALGDGKNVGSDYVYTPDGWDIEVAGRLPLLPWVEFAGKYYHWNRLRGQADREGMRYSLKLQPVPLVSVKAQYDSPEGSQDDDWGVEASLKYRFGVPLSDQMQVARVKAHGPVHRRFEQVRREYAQRVERVRRAEAAASLGVDSLEVNIPNTDISNSVVDPLAIRAQSDARIVQEARSSRTYEIVTTFERFGDTAAATFNVFFEGSEGLDLVRDVEVDVMLPAPPPASQGVGVAGGLAADPFRFTFPAGRQQYNVPIRVTVIPDSDPEDPERLSLRIVGEPLVVPLLEIRDERPQVRFAREADTAEEGGRVTVTATVAPVPIERITVPVMRSGTLSLSIPGTLTFAQGQSSASFQFTLPTNEVADGARTVRLELMSDVSSDPRYELGSPAAYSLTITDDDVPATGTPVVSFAVGTSTAAEGNPVSAQLQAQPPPTATAPLTVRLRLDGTASGTGTFADYSASPALTAVGGGVYTVTMSGASLPLSLPTRDDTEDESDETLLLTVLPGAGYVPGAPPLHRATIVDDDTLTVGFTCPLSDTARTCLSPDAVSEAGSASARTLIATVAPTLAPPRPLTVSLRLEGTAGEGAGMDYRLLTGVSGTGLTRTLTLPRGTTASVAITLQIQDEEPPMRPVIEGAEGIVLRLLPGDGYTLDPAASVYRVQIEDDERAVRFSAAAASVAEGRRTAVSLVPQGPARGLLLVQVGLAGSAQAGASCDDASPPDYVLSGDSLVAVSDPAAATTRSVGVGGAGSVSLTLETCTDSATEGVETAELTIQPSGAYLAGSPSIYRLTITDSAVATVPIVTFDRATGSATEGNISVSISLRANPLPTAPLTIPYSVVAVGTTAVAGTDYTAPAPNAAASFLAQQSLAQFSLQLLDDNLNDGTKILVLELPASATPNAYIVGAANRHTLTIADDESPAAVSAVSFAQPSSSIEENAGPLSIVLNIAPPAQAAFTVRYSTAGVSIGASTAAEAGTDYVLPSGTLPVTVGMSAASIQLALIGNSRVDPDRGLALQLLADTETPARYALGAQSSHNVTIQDDDTPRLGFAAAGASLREDAAPHSITVSVSPAATGDIRAPLTVSGGAVPGSSGDYTLAAVAPGVLSGTAPNYQLEIPRNTQTVVLRVTQVQNLDQEGVEEAIFTLGAGAGYALSAQPAYTLQISDDDLPANALTVSFAETGSSVLEDAGTVQIGVQASRAAPSGGLAVSYQALGSATPGTDYATLSGTVTIPAGETMASISLAVTDDVANEADEEVVLTLQGSPTNQYFVATPNSYTLTIQDNDVPAVGFSAAARTVMENAGTVRVPITASAAPNRELRLRYGVRRGAGITGSDHAPLSGVAILGAGSMQAVIEVSITDDTEDENTETLTFTLSDGSGYTLRGGASLSYVLTIQDDDVPMVGFDLSSNQVAEDAANPLQVRVSVSPPPLTELRIPVTVGGSATGSGTDYTLTGLSAGQLVIAANLLSATLAVTPVNDLLIEGGETVQLELEAAGGMGDYALRAGAARHTVTIADDEQTAGARLVQFAGTTSTATEGGADATVQVSVTRLSAGEMLTMRLRVSPGSGVADGDYSLSVGGSSVTPGGDGRFTVGVTGTSAEPDSVDLTVTATNDSADEPNESLAFTLEADTANPPDYLLGNVLTHTVTLIDDDTPAVSFAADGDGDRMGTVSEGDGSVALTVAVSPVPAQDLTISVQPTGTATDPSDYTLETLTVSRGSATGTLRVTLANDGIDEPDESLTLTLQMGTGYELSATPANNAYALTIADDDTPQLSFVGSRTTIAENALDGVVATVTVTATPAPRAALMARVATETIGGLEDSEYSLAGLTGASSPFMLSIPARTTDGETSVSVMFTLDPADDNMPEGTEGVRFTLQAGGTGDYGVGAASQHEVLIQDNEAASAGVSVSFMSAAGSAAEDNTAPVRVDVMGLAAGESVDVLLRVTETSVTDGDYSLNPAADTVTGVVTLAVSGSAATTDSATLTVTAEDDDLDELDETLTLDLGNSVGNYVFGAVTRHTVTITDTDVPAVSFAADDSGDRAATVSEDSGSVDLTVAVAPAPAQALTVGVQGSGTATATSDYTLGTLTVSRGSATGTLRVTLEDDDIDEPGESLTLTLQTGTGYVPSATPADNAYALRIDDDDTPRLSFAAAASNAREASTPAPVTITVRAEPAPRTALTVPVTVGGTATEGAAEDYTLSGLGTGTPRTLSIPMRALVTAASSSATLTLTPVDNDAIENPETVLLELLAATETASGAAGDYELGDPARHSVEIADDDAATAAVQVSFAVGSSVATERGADATVTVTATGLAADASLSVMLRVTETSVAASDYTLTPAAVSGVVTLTIAGATGSASLTVMAENDGMGDELDETLTLDLTAVAGSYAVGARGRHTVTIRDATQPVVNFAAAASSAAEGDGIATLGLSASPAPDAPLTLSFTVAPGTTDHTTPATAAIGRGAGSANYVVTLMDDTADEADQTLTFTLTAGTGYAVGTANEHILTVTDDDTPALSLGAPSVAALDEDVPDTVSTVAVSVSPPPRAGNALTIPVQLGGTATEGAAEDYTLSASGGTGVALGTQTPPLLTIPAAMSGATLTLTPVDDMAPEGLETIRLTLLATGVSGGSGDYRLGAPASQQVNLRDDEAATLGVQVSFAIAASTVAEGGSVTVAVDVSGLAASESLSVMLSVTETSVSESDYTLTPAANASDVVTLAVTGDADPMTTDSASLTFAAATDVAGDELSETLSLALVAGTGYTLSGTVQHTVTITDAARPTVAFAQPMSSASEGDGAVDLAVSARPAPAEDLIVPVMTATVPAGYTVPETLTISRGAAGGVLRVTLAADDSIDNDDLTVMPTLQADTHGSAAGDYELGTRAAHTLTIVDDDTRGVTVSPTAVAVEEEDATGATYTVVLDTQPTGLVTVTPFSGDTMVATVSPAVLSFTTATGNWSTAQTVTVMGGPDDGNTVTDGTTVTHTVAGADADYALVTPASVSVTVTDDDATDPAASFASASAVRATEGAAAATVTVELATPPAAGTTVTVTLQVGGSATRADDYSLTFGTTPVTPPAATNTFTLDIVGDGVTDDASFTVTAETDSLIERDETLTLTLIAGTGYSLTAMSLTHTVTITDATAVPEVAFDMLTSNPNEAAGTATIGVTATSMPASTLTLGVLATGTATEGVDYSLGILTVADTGTAGTLTVTLTDDMAIEGAEDAVLTLQADTASPARYTLGSETTHTLTIADDDQPVAGFAQTAAAVTEPAAGTTTVTATVRVTPARATDAAALSIPVTVGGTATFGPTADYTLAGLSTGTPRMLSIGMGQSSADITVTVRADAEAETSETVVLTLGNLAGHELRPAVYTLTINDRAVPSIAFSTAADLSLTEADAGDAAVTGTLTLAATGMPAPSATAPLAVTINLAGSAEHGNSADYTLSAGTGVSGVAVTTSSTSTSAEVTLTAPMGTFTFTVVADNANEATETAILTVASGTGYRVGANASRTVTITDDDEPTVSFALDDSGGDRMADAAEGATLTLTASIDPVPANALTVGVGTVTADTTAASADYSLGTLRFAANDDDATLRVQITDDAAHEAAETLVLELQGGTGYAVAGPEAERRYTLTIPENDLPVISFASGSATAAEADGMVDVIVNVSPVPRTGVTLNVPITTSGTATEGAAGDYVLSGLSAGASGNLSIAAGSSTATFMVALRNDDDVEVQETVVLNLGTGTGYTLGTTRQHTLTVTSEDVLPLALSIAASSSSVAEDGGGSVTFTVTSTEAVPAGETLTANLRVGGTATAPGATGNDYTLSDGIAPNNDGDFTRMLAAGETSLSFQVTIVDDAADEADETIRFEVLAGTGYERGSPSSAELRITDNDEPTVSFALDSDGNNREADAAEGATLMLTVEIDPAPRAALTVGVMALTTSTAEAADYSLGTLRFAADADDAPLRVQITDDAAHEAAETLVLELQGGTEYAVAGTEAERRYTVTIPANDLPVLSFAASSATAAEADGNVNVIVNVSPVLRAGATALSVPITADDSSTATATSDYTLSGSLSIAPGSSTATFTGLTLVDDTAVEVQETIVLNLGTGTGYTRGTPNQYTLTVTSEDMLPLELGIAASSASVEEGEGPVTITVTSTRAVTGSGLTVNLRVSSTTARRGGANSDYMLPAGIVPNNDGDFTRAIAAGQDSLSFQVTISDDNVNEADETLRFELRSSAEYSLGASSAVDVRITDDDTPTVSFAEDASSDRMADANEGATLTLTANISPAPASALTVGVGTGTGTTAQAADYSLGTLRFAANATSEMLIVQVTNDAAHEPEETLVLQLQGGTGYAVTGTAAHSRYTVTIPENDLPVLDFAAGAASAAEADGSVDVIVNVSPVLRTGASALNVPITTSGTAAEGAAADYVLSGLSAGASGNLRITPGSSTATFMVALRNDIEVENPETIVLSLGTGTGYTLGTTRQHTLTVSSEDRLPILSFDVGSRTVAENGGASTVTVRANPAPQSSVTFTLRVSGTATRGATTGTGDYTLPAGIAPDGNGDFTRVLAAGASSLTFDIAVVDDSVDETNPTVIFTLRTDTATPSTYQVGSMNAQFTLTITDDDDPLPQIQFSGTGAATVSEGAASTNIGIESTANVASRLSVNYEVCTASSTPRCSSDSTASSGDYSGLPASIAIARGSSSGNMVVTLVDDILDENNETLVLRLTSGSGYTLGARRIYTLTITDNDIPLVAFADSTSEVAENAGTTTVTAVAVILNPAYDATAADDGAPFSGNDDQYVYIDPIGDIVVPVRVSGAAARPADYSLSFLGGSDPNYTLTIFSSRPGPIPPEADITVTVVNDSADESDETVVFTLSDPAGEPSLRGAGGSTHTLTIRDDDMPLPTVSFEASKSVGEGAGTATVQVMLGAAAPSGGLTFSRLYRVDTSSTATAGTDYTALTGSLTFAGGSRMAAISVTIDDDSADEPDETIVLVLQASAGNYLLRTPNRHTLTITDDDVPMVRFAAASDSVAEDAMGAARNVSVTVNVSPAPARALSVALTFAGTATLTGTGADYSLSGVTGTAAVRQLAVRAGETAASFTVAVADDSVFEGDEQVAVSFAAPAANAGYAVAGAGNLTYTLTITDNDPMPSTPMVRFSMAASSAIEPVSGTVTANVQVRLHPATMTAPVGGLPVRYQLQTSTAVEGAAADYTIGGFDRTASTGIITIPQGNNAANIPVAVRADAVAEADETIALRLIAPAAGAADYMVIAANRDHTLTIGANGLVASFALASSMAAEGDAATSAPVTVSLAGGNAPAGGLPVNYSVLPAPRSTATATSDYTIAGAAGSVTIPAGTASATLTISVQPDSVAESDETVVLQLAAPTSPGAYRVGAVNEHTLTIPANDMTQGVPTLGFAEAGPVDAREGGAAAIVRAAMSPAPASLVVVTATLNAGTVPAGDYAINPPGRSLSFTSAAPAATLTVTANEDTDMDNERITLGLPAAAGSYTLREGRSSIEVVLRDNDNMAPAANFVGAAAGSYRERDRRKGGSDIERGPYRLRVGLPSAVAASTTLTLQARPGSDVTYGANNDYTLGGGATVIASEQGANRDTTFRVTIAANASEAAFTVIVPDDYRWELDESLTFTVLDPATGNAYSVGAMSRHVLTLQDGLAPASPWLWQASRGVTYNYYGLSHSHVLSHQLSGGTPAATEQTGDDEVHRWRVNEGARSVSVAVNSSAAMVQDAEVHVNFYPTVSHLYAARSDSLTLRSASSGEDYMPPAQVLNFRAGQTGLTFTVPIVDDMLVEGLETIHMQITTPGLNGISGVLGLYGNHTGDGCGVVKRDSLSACELNVLLTAKAQEGLYAIAIVDNDLPRPSFARASGAEVLEEAIAGGTMVTRNVDINLEGVPDGLISSLDLKLRFAATTGDVAVAASGMATDAVAAVQARFATHTLTRDSATGTDWTLTVPDGATATGITLTFNDDTVTEGREVLEVRLLPDPSSPTTYLQGATTAHDIAIVDDDLVTVSFASNTVTVTEPAATGATSTATISFSSDIASAAATTVRYAVNGASDDPASSATSGSDYQALATPMQVVIPANQTTATLTVTVLGDAENEGDEQLALRLLPSDDYEVDSASATFVLVIDDQDAPSEHRVQFGMAESSVSEGVDGGSVNIAVAVDRSARTALRIPLRVVFGSNTAGVGDYGLPDSIQVTILQGTSTANLRVTITDDNLIEGSEILVLEIHQEDLPSGTVRGDPTTHTLTIRDNDSAAISFATTDSSVDEDAGTQNVMLMVSHAPANDLTVSRASDDDPGGYSAAGSATAGSDYTLPASITVSAGQTAAVLPIEILDDRDIEGPETIELSLADGPEGSAYTAGSPSTLTLTINASDLPRVGFRVASGEVQKARGNTRDDTSAGLHIARMVFSRYPPAGVTVPVRIRVAGTAMIGDNRDYVLTGATLVSGDIYAVDFQRDRDLQFGIDLRRGAANGATVEIELLADTAAATPRYEPAPGMTAYTVTVRDPANPTPAVSFNTVQSMATEGSSDPVVIAIDTTLSSGMLNYRVVPGETTAEPADYSLSPSGAVDLSQPHSISLTAPQETGAGAETNHEVVVLELTAGSGYVLGDPTKHYVYITDDDAAAPTAAVANLLATASSVREYDRIPSGIGRSPYRLRVRLSSAAPAGGVAVSMRARPSSTVTYGAGNDYTLGGGAGGISSEQGQNRDTTFTVTVAANASEASFTVAVSDDYQWEQDETLTFTLLDDPDTAMAGAYAVGLASTFVLTLRDGLQPTVVRRADGNNVRYDYFGQSHSHVLSHQLSGGAATEQTGDDEVHRWRVNEDAGSVTVTVTSRSQMTEEVMIPDPDNPSGPEITTTTFVTNALLQDVQVHVNFYPRVSHLYPEADRDAPYTPPRPTSLGDDYVPPSRIINFPAGQTSVSFDLEIVDDMQVEGLEAIHMQITTPGLNDISGVSGVLGLYGNNPGDGCPEEKEDALSACELSVLLTAKAQEGLYAIVIVDDDPPRPSFARASGADVFEAAIAGGSTVTQNVDIELGELVEGRGLPSSLALKLSFVATTGDVTVAASGTATDAVAAVQTKFTNQPAPSAGADPPDDHTLTRDSADGTDWTLTVPAGATATGITLTFNDDAAPEGREVLEVRLLPDPSATRTYERGAATTHTIAIVDDD